MPAGLRFMMQAILGIMGSQSLLHVRAPSVRLSEGFLVLMAVCFVRSSCVLYLVEILPYYIKFEIYEIMCKDYSTF